MKKKQILKTTLLALALTLGGASTAWADEVSVTTAAEFGAAYKTAMDATDGGSTTIILSEGTYAVTSDHITYGQLEIPASRTVTVKAANNADVTLKVKVQANKTGATGSLIFDGIKLLSTAGANYGFVDFRSNTSTLGDVIFKNCEITSTTDEPLDRYIVSGGNASGTVNSVVFDNCLIHDLGTSYDLIRPTIVIKSISITNSTIYNYGGDNIFNPQTTSSETDFSFTFTNNTVYKISKLSNTAICKTESKYSTSSTYTFKDNIIYQGFSSTTPYLVYATGGSLLAQNNLVESFGTYNMTSATSSTISDYTLAGLGLASVPFLDAANYEFNISSASVLATASTTGGVIGDPEWLTDPVVATSISPLAKSGTVNISGKGEYKTGESVTLTATANYGYTFVKWTDAMGTQLSTENPYTFTPDAAQTIVAIFEVNTSVYQELPLSSASAYMDLSKAITSEGVITTTVDDSKPYYIASSSWSAISGSQSIKGIPANGASNAYVEFKVHNTTENWYAVNYKLNWSNTTDPNGNYSYPTITITDDETGEVIEQSFGLQGDNAKSYRITKAKLTTGYKTIRFFFNNKQGGSKTELGQVNFTANTYGALPLVSSSESATYLDLSSYSSNSGARYESGNDNIGNIKNGYYVDGFYINNTNEEAHYALRMGISKNTGVGTFTITISNATTGVTEASGTFARPEGSNYANYIFNLTGSITPGIKKIRYDFASEGTDYLMNFNHVTFFKTDVNITDAKAATLVLPFDVTIPDGVEAYTLNYKSGNDAAKATAVETTIGKDTPVLLNANKGTYTFVPASDVQAESTNASPVSGALHGTYAGATLTSSDNAYVLQNGAEGLGFYQVGATDINVGAYRAYLVADGVDARMLSIDFSGDETTGIKDAVKSEELRIKSYYDLQGRKVAQPTRGLYIVNGKKVVIK